jgi:hypothetical protein
MNNKLVGTWKLIAATSEDIATGQKTAIHKRTGYLNYGPDGRVFAILVDSDRKKPVGDIATATEAEALFRSMVAYSVLIRSKAITWSIMSISHGMKRGPAQIKLAITNSTVSV